MCMYIGIEDLVANAIIELVEKSQRNEVLFSEINRYGATVVQILSEKDNKAILILSKERTSAFLNDYSDFFELYTNGTEEGIRLKENISVSQLWEKFKSTNEMIKPEFADAEHFRNQLHIKQRHLKWLKCLQDFAIEQNIDFDFLVIKANQFNSGFGKLAFENIEIVFPGLTSLCNFKKVTNALSAQKSEREKFSYIFYRRKDRTCQVDAKRLASKLGALAIEEAFS